MKTKIVIEFVKNKDGSYKELSRRGVDSASISDLFIAREILSSELYIQAQKAQPDEKYGVVSAIAGMMNYLFSNENLDKNGHMHIKESVAKAV